MDTPRPKVLIIDDDESFVESNRDLLEACGYEVHAAGDGASGIELAKKVRPGVIILDVMMTTDTEGLEVARRLREIPELSHTGVVLVTGVARVLHLPAGLTPDDTWLPVDRVLEKPIDPGQLIREIRRVLESKGKGAKRP